MKLFFLLMIIIPSMNGYSQKFNRAETIELNDMQTYYEVYGQGNPLFLLHGFT